MRPSHRPRLTAAKILDVAASSECSTLFKTSKVRAFQKSVMSSNRGGNNNSALHSSATSLISQAGMQTGNQHSMGTQQQTTAPSQGQSDPSAMLSPAGGQPVQLGQPMLTAGTLPSVMQQQQPQYQYVITMNPQGQQVLQPVPTMSFPSVATVPAQGTQQPGQQYIITSGLPPNKGGQQPQMIGSSPAGTNNQTLQGKAPAYTLTSTGIVSHAANPSPQTFMITHNQMGGSPTMQTANPGMMPNTSHPSLIKAETGKQQPQQMPSNQGNTNPGGQTQQMAPQPHQQMLLPPGMYVNPAQSNPGQTQAFIQNGQIIIRPQDGQATSQLMFSSQGLQMQPHPQAIQPNLTQQMPAGLTTSMQPMAMTSVASSNNMVRPTYTTQPPSGKTQISRAPPTLLPATSTTTSMTSRPTTSTASLMTQPSPKSKQKMSPRNSGPFVANKTTLSASSAPKSILNTIKNQTGNSVSPPVLTSHGGSPLSQLGAPGSPSGGGPPVLQTSLAAPPPPQAVPTGPPVLHPMNMMPTGGNSYISSKPSPMVSSLSNGIKPTDVTGLAGKTPIMPAIKKSTGMTPTAAPMEYVGNRTEVNGKSSEVKSLTKTPTECLTHVIDGHVIQESSQPFPLDDDIKGGKYILFFLTLKCA